MTNLTISVTLVDFDIIFTPGYYTRLVKIYWLNGKIAAIKVRGRVGEWVPELETMDGLRA